MTTSRSFTNNDNPCRRAPSVLLLTGPEAVVQGYGDARATALVQDALTAAGKQTAVASLENPSDLDDALSLPSDIVWSSLYRVGGTAGQNRSIVPAVEIHPLLEQWGIPHVGSPSSVFDVLLDKAETNRRLASLEVPVPHQAVVSTGDEMPEVECPVLVKPRWESESRGISEASIVITPKALRDVVASIWSRFEQDALVEEYLEKEEYTATVIGRAPNHQVFGALNEIAQEAYDTYPLLTPALKEGALRLRQLGDEAEEVCGLAVRTATLLGCRDHVRIDMRRDRRGTLKVIEVNGIPGLQPGLSRSLAMYALYRPEVDANQSQRALINAIVDGAVARLRSGAGP